MKTFHQIVVVALAGLLAMACTDVDCVYGDTSWYGEYETRFVDGEVSVPTFMTTSISLTFSEDGQECRAVYATKGMDGMLYGDWDSQYTYNVQWSSRNTFTLSILLVDQPYVCYVDQTMVVYAGKISGRKMKLDLLSCDRVEQTIELKKTD